MLITNEQIEHYIEKIPPVPKVLQKTLMLLREGELVQAASVAKEDKALASYLKELVNKPVYGFSNEVSDVSQIFGILGVARSQQAVYAYMVSLLSPDKWEFFALNKNTFYALQADLAVSWGKILQHLKINNNDIKSAIALIPASVIVSEALFNEKKDEVVLLRSTHDIDLNTILQRLCDKDLFDICVQIAQKWEMDPKIVALIRSSSGVHPSSNEKIDLLAKWMHLLLFYTFSQPAYIEAGLNDFLEFQIGYVSDIYDEFATVMEIA